MKEGEGGRKEGRKWEVKSQMRKSNLNIREEGFLIRGNGRLQKEVVKVASVILKDTWRQNMAQLEIRFSHFLMVYETHSSANLHFNTVCLLDLQLKPLALLPWSMCVHPCQLYRRIAIYFAVISDDRGRMRRLGIVYRFGGSDRSAPLP